MSVNPDDPTLADVAILEQLWEENSCDCYNEKYEIKVSLFQYCINDEYPVTVEKKVSDPVDAEFELPTPLCQNEVDTFQNNSTAGCDAVSYSSLEDSVFYHWDFGDCNIVTDPVYTVGSTISEFPNITHFYALPGIYTVTLTAVSYCGETDTSAEITVYPQPISKMAENMQKN